MKNKKKKKKNEFCIWKNYMPTNFQEKDIKKKHVHGNYIINYIRKSRNKKNSFKIQF